MIYGDPGSVIALNLPGGPGDYQLSVAPGLPLARRLETHGFRRVSAGWRFAGTLFAISEGDGFGERVRLETSGPGRATAAGVALDRSSCLQAGPLGLDFGAHGDPARDQTPHRLRLSFRGVVPLREEALLIDMFAWGIGRIALFTRFASNQLFCVLGRGDAEERDLFSTGERRPGVEQLLELEWSDNSAGAGGSLRFFIDGKPAGGPLATRLKPRLTPQTGLSVNVSLGNLRPAIDGLVVREVRVGFDRPVVESRYVPVASGPLAGALLPDLVVDARALTSPQPPATLAWRGPDGSVATLDVVVGPIEIPAGQAYKAVLVDWSSGAGVAHPDQLVMIRLAAQNCRFEDGWLGAAQPAWSECLPRGPVPVINGIAYRCEAIRQGDYVQFQFGYDWDASVMPANPFGDPSGRNGYMVPHKWLIYDRDDRLLATIETPDGGPLNGADKMHLYGGPSDGRGNVMTDRKHRWYPHGTVRSGIIWRSRDPGDHDRAGVRAAVPLFDLGVPFGSHTDYSVNGFDLRIFMGGAGNDGQANGFGNVRVIPWKQSDYATMVGNAGRTKDPFTALYTANSMAANAALWLQYTPFNIQGRSPVTGPGGVRDDRQIIAEPVALYMNQPDGLRPHDGTPWRAIALDYLTGYASDAIHAFERGRNVPLFKGDARRPIVLRNHYYGSGDLGVPENQAWYQQGGRVSGWLRGVNPLRVAAPYAGDVPERPYFGTFQIDKAHGHQFPGWGSLLFRTPEFAFLGHRFFDQNRLYANEFIGDPWLASWASRDGAWAFLHAALAWKTASATSQRLYSRAEVMDFVLFDFEQFHARHYASTPGFRNPPANLMPNGQVDMRLAVYAAAQFFGPCHFADSELQQHEFFIGYWLSALAAAEKMGFNAAIRRASAKAGEMLDWLIGMHRKRVVGRILQGSRLQTIGGSSYLLGLWSRDHIVKAGGDVTRLPRDYAALMPLWGETEGWDSYIGNGQSVSRDGQALDQLIAAPSLLRYLLGQSGDDLIEAQRIANGWREAKRMQELARGDQAGTGWFAYLQATNNPARPVQT